MLFRSKHHECQPSISLQRVLQMEFNDRLSLPIFQPKIAGDQGVVFVSLAVALLPVVVLAGGKFQPSEKARHRDTGSLGPTLDEVDHGITNIMGDPSRF